MPDPHRETHEELLRIDRKRRRRWRRAWAAIGLVLLLLVAVRAWWGHIADRRLQAVIDRYHAAGEPILIADFAPKSVPQHDENAARYYEDAAASVVIPSDLVVRSEYFITDIRLPFLHERDSRQWVANNGELSRLMRNATVLTECDWGVRFASPLYLQAGADLRWVRRLQRTLCALAAAHHVVGDDEACVETLLQIDTLNRRVIAPRESCLIGYFIASACESLMCEYVEAIAPSLIVADSTADDGGASARPAPRARVQALMAALLGDEAWNTGWWNALNGERATILDSMRAVENGGRLLPGGVAGSLMGKTGNMLIGPTFRLDAATGLEAMTRLRDAGLMDTYPAAGRAAPARVGGMNGGYSTGLDEVSHVFSITMIPSLRAAANYPFRLRTDRRLAATALAIRLYELDHGQRPETLVELVPDYLPSVPMDPYAEPARSLTYVPANHPPILYSVYRDGIDDGGVNLPSAEQAGTSTWERDKLFYLDGDRPSEPIQWENVLVNPPKKAGGTADDD